ncbi:MAG: helix-turn-helix domain-containing protein [bacterium]|nr:helix-turn-helix domain-containing protein [bacterium]
MSADLEALKANPELVDRLDAACLPSVLDRASAEHGRLAVLERAVHRRLRSVQATAALAGDDDELLDDTAVARLLSVPTSHVADLRRRGDLRETPVGGKYKRVRRGDLRDFVQRQGAAGRVAR